MNISYQGDETKQYSSVVGLIITCFNKEYIAKFNKSII